MSGTPGAVPDAARYVIRDARVPAVLLTDAAVPGTPDREGLVRVDFVVDGGRIGGIAPAGHGAAGRAGAAGLPALEMDGGQVWPAFVDLHTHLDKGHIWPRQQNPDGSFTGALRATIADREAYWTVDEVCRRMDFSLRCARAHGTGTIRTHLDSRPPLDAIVWPAFAKTREAWRGRMALEAVNLVPVEFYADDADGRAMARLVAEHGGVLGAVCYIRREMPDLLRRVFALATEFGLDLDLHIDEGLDPAARSLELVARTALETGFRGRIACGHCCALAIQPADILAETIALVADAGIAVVSLPMCNMYLQDRQPGRTPRLRGVVPALELRGAGVPVIFSSDNTRDPFYGFGDLDMLEVFREATRIAHLDADYAGWAAAVATTPAAVMGAVEAGRIAPGLAADLVLFRGRGYSELLSRPQSDRVVLRAGRAIDTGLPDYRELDDLFAGGAGS